MVVKPPPTVSIGDQLKPGSFVSTIRIEMPSCLRPSVLVRQASQM